MDDISKNEQYNQDQRGLQNDLRDSETEVDWQEMERDY
jgi:hypothetical protein